MNIPSRRRWQFGLALWLVLGLSPVRHALEATMTVQMLVQIPLLALAGWWLVALLPRKAVLATGTCNRGGISGLLLASLAAMVWMLPRMLDSALADPWIESAKFASIPLLIGLPLALSWPRAGFVVRGVFLAEVIATAFRLGWLYRISPVRLCSNYLLDDQQRLGGLLLVTGALLGAVVAWHLMWGRIAIDTAHGE